MVPIADLKNAEAQLSDIKYVFCSLTQLSTMFRLLLDHLKATGVLA